MLIEPKRFGDDRGHFVEIFNQARFQAECVSFSPMQENQSLLRFTGTVRGLHFQREPFAQAKLVRVLRGSIFDVAVDIPPSSITFGKLVGVQLSAENGHELFIPTGVAHGFYTLGSVDKMPDPKADAGDENEAKITVRGLIVAGGQASTVLEF